MVSRRTTAIILSIIIAGVGQMYLRKVFRGIVILIASFAIQIGLTYLLGWWGVIPGFAFWIWQIFDAAKIAKEQESKTPDSFNTGWENKP